jgi:hypothetical protein
MASFLSVLLEQKSIGLTFRRGHEQVKPVLTAWALCGRGVPHDVEGWF